MKPRIDMVRWDNGGVTHIICGTVEYIRRSDNQTIAIRVQQYDDQSCAILIPWHRVLSIKEDIQT